MTTVHVIPCPPLPDDIEHEAVEPEAGERVELTTQWGRSDCPLCRVGRCVQLVRHYLSGATVVTHGTLTQ